MTTNLRALVRDLIPALDAYEMAGRRSYYKDGVLHWEMTAQFWEAQRLRERVDALLQRKTHD